MAASKVDPPDWRGRTVVCIASGPSLTVNDCELVKQSGHPAIVTNTTFRMCPWADVLFAFDVRWWNRYYDEAKLVFDGRMFAYAKAVKHPGVETVQGMEWFTGVGNSGACAIAVALAAGASKVVLLGVDCMKLDGAVHWHGNHPAGMSNASSMKRWPYHYEQIAKQADKRGVPVINASRQTALKCFKRGDLESEL